VHGNVRWGFCALTPGRGGQSFWKDDALKCCPPGEAEDRCLKSDPDTQAPPLLCAAVPSWATTCGDAAAYSNPMYGLQCMTPTPAQCNQMYGECFCPSTSKAIDNWGEEGPCVPDVAAQYSLNMPIGLCTTCDTFIQDLGKKPDPKNRNRRFGFVAGDFQCRVDPVTKSWALDCDEGDPGAVSRKPCPVGAAASIPLAPTAPAQGNGTLSCGHGEFNDALNACVCEKGIEPSTGKEFACWQTNRERSNRHPNGAHCRSCASLFGINIARCVAY
jgi:hypothetical protein